MNRKAQLLLISFCIFVIFFASCRNAEDPETATPTPTPTLPAQNPTVTPIPSLFTAAEAPHPRLIGQNPAAGEEAPLDGTFELYFDQPMDPTSAAAVQIVDAEGEQLTGELSWPQPRILQFKATKRLQPNARYQAVIAETAVSAAGVPLLEGLSLDFYTIGDLSVSQIAPAENAAEVATDSTITVIFNRPVVPLLVAEEQANLANPLSFTPDIPGQGEWVNTSVYVYRPAEQLIGRQQYAVRVNHEVINEASATGAQMVEDFVSTFTVTPPTFDALELVGQTWNPRSGYDKMPLDQVYRLHFNQPMDPASTEAAISLRNLTTPGFAPLEFAWNELLTTVTITPTQLLDLQSRFQLTLNNSAQSAHGGTLAQPFEWQATTYQRPHIVKTDPRDGGNQTYYSSVFSIHFASPMDEESMAGKVLITPEILGDPDGLYNEWGWQQNYYGFKPSTTYTINILPGMKDIYGNEITEERTVTFTTAALTPSASLNLPYSIALYRQGGSESLWVNHQNVENLTVDLYEVNLRQFGGVLNGNINGLRFMPAPENRVWQRNTTVETPLNEQDYQRFLLSQNVESELPTGYYFVALDSPQIGHNEPHLQTQVLLMATANVTLKTTASEALIWVTDLDSGEPLPGAPVSLYDKRFNPVFEGVTDEFGRLYRDDLDLNPDHWEGRYFAVAGQPGDEVFGLAISSWSDGISPRDFGIYTSYYLQPDEPTVYIYTERPVYRPGHPVYFKGIVRLNDDLQYSLPEFDTVDIEIASFDEVIFEDTLSISDFGSFAGEITLDDEAALGTYTISVMGRGGYIGTGYFEVAEFRKPTFQVDLAAASTDVVVGDTIDVVVEADFFSGGSVANSQVEWYVRAEGYLFSGGRELSTYSFGSRERDLGYYYYNRSSGSSEVVAEGSGQTDSLGRLQIQIPAEYSEGNGSKRFIIEATVTDLAGNQVSGRTAVVVHASLIYPGIKPNQSVGQKGNPSGFEAIAVDWDGEPLPGRPVTVEVVERRWFSYQEEDDRGRTIWRTEVEEIPVAMDGEADLITDADGRVSFEFVPPSGGVFRAYVTTRDSLGNTASASTFMWVSSREYVSWRRVNDHSFELISDRSSYSPGETAEILIASPFQGEVSALVTVERGHIKQQEVIRLVSNSTIYRLPITGDMAPNVFVSVLVMKGVDETSLAPDFKLGMTQFTVDREEQELAVTITPDETQLSPGDTVNYTVSVRDHAGRPVAAELSLSLTDLAVLTIANRKELPILDHFYSRQWLSVRTATLLARNMDAYNKELEDQIKGGGGGAGTYGVQTIREEFPDTTFWEGQLTTGADGLATVSIPLPDSLTTWRLDVRAVTLDTKVGQGTNDIVSTLPVLVSPQTPRFFVVGDQVRLGTAVHNNSNEAVSGTVELQAVGVTLLDEAQQQITIPAQQQGYFTWDVVVDDVTRVDLVFAVETGRFSDASRPPLATLEGGGLPVYKYEVPETVGTSGQLLDGGAVVESIGLPIYPNHELTQGTVTVKVSPSLASAMTDGLDYLTHFEYECTEQIVSKFLPNLLTVQALTAAGIDDPQLQANLDAQVNTALQRIYRRQLPDGGWPWWEGPESSSLVSTYVVLALVEAVESGYPVSQRVLDDGVRYLTGHLNEVDGLSGRYKENRQAFLLYVLARAGRPSNQHMNDLYERRASLDLYAQAFLAQALYYTDPGDPRLITMNGDFVSHALLSATGANWEEAERDYWNWNTDTRTTAIVLDTMVKLDPDNPLVANAVRWLMAHRTDGRWQGTQETAWTIMALTDFMVATGELQPNYNYEVALNGQSMAAGTANADTLRQVEELQIDITELLTDELNRLAFGRTDGPGNLYYTTHLEAYLPVEEVEPLDRGFAISRSYYDAADRETPISEIELGQTFLARLTIVVPQTQHYVLIEDFLPAGLEAVDQSLNISQQVGTPERYAWDENEYREKGWGWWYFDHIELRDEKVVISADVLPAGTYEYVYLVRASVPGEYHVIPPTAQEFYFPEVYGRGAGSLFTVLSRG